MLKRGNARKKFRQRPDRYCKIALLKTKLPRRGQYRCL
jgi:hypothetical protein